MQPNNFLRWSESSFTDPQGDLSWRRRQRTVWGAETAPNRVVKTSLRRESKTLTKPDLEKVAQP